MDNRDRITTPADRAAQAAAEGGLIPRNRRPLPTNLLNPDTTNTAGNLPGEPVSDQGNINDIPLTWPGGESGSDQEIIDNPPQQWSIPAKVGRPLPLQPQVHTPGTRDGLRAAPFRNDDLDDVLLPTPIQAPPQPRGIRHQVARVAALFGRGNNQTPAAPQPARRLPNPILTEDPTRTIGGSRYVDLGAPAGPLVQDARARAQADAERAAAEIRAREGTVEQHTNGAVYQPVVPGAWNPNADPLLEARDPHRAAQLRGEGKGPDNAQPDSNGEEQIRKNKVKEFLNKHSDHLLTAGSLGAGVALRILNDHVLHLPTDTLSLGLKMFAGGNGALWGAGGAAEWIFHKERMSTDNTNLEKIKRLESGEKMFHRLQVYTSKLSMLAIGFGAGGVDPEKLLHAIEQLPEEISKLDLNPFNNEKPATVPAASAPAVGATPTVPETPTPTPVVIATNTPDTGLTTSGTPKPSGTPTPHLTSTLGTNTGATPTAVIPSASPSPIATITPTPPPGTSGLFPPGSTTGQVYEDPPVTTGTGSTQSSSGTVLVDDPPGGGTGIPTADSSRHQENSPGYNDLPENKIDTTKSVTLPTAWGSVITGVIGENLVRDGQPWDLVGDAEKGIYYLMDQNNVAGYTVDTKRLTEDLFTELPEYASKGIFNANDRVQADFSIANNRGRQTVGVTSVDEIIQDYKNRGILVRLPEPVEHIKFGEDTGYQEKGPGFNDLPENKIDITPEYDFVINGNRVKGNLDNLTFNDKRWIIFENGEKNVDHFKQKHEIQGYHINPTRLKEELYPTIGLYGEQKLVPGTFEFKLFHFTNGTGTKFQEIFEDPEFETDLKNRGILEIDRPDPTTIVAEEPVIPNHVDVDKGYIEKTSGFNDDPAVNPEAPHRDKYGVIVENVKLGDNTGYQEKPSGFNDDPATNQQAPRFDDPANLVDPDKGYKEKTSGFNDDPAVNPEAPQRDGKGIIVNHINENRGYQEKTSGFNDDPAVNPEATPYHKPLELTSPYGDHKITGSIYDGTLQWDGKDWRIFENGMNNIKEATISQGLTEAYYVDQEKYKGELERLIILWTKGELTNPEDKLVYYLSEGVGTEYDRVKADPATIQALKDKGIMKTR